MKYEATRWLTTEEAAAYLKLSPRTLFNWRREGRGPPHHRQGDVLRYDLAELDHWLRGLEPPPGAPAAALSAA